LAGAEPRVLGINAAYHESAACVVEGGRVLFAVEAERLSRVKHAKPARVDNVDSLPWAAIDLALQETRTAPEQLTAVTFSLAPGLRKRTVGQDPPDSLDRTAGWGTEEGEAEVDRRLATVPGAVERRLGVPAARFRFVPHHRAHAASAFFTSPYENAALLVLDGIGEHETGWLGQGAGASLTRLAGIPYPHSLGLLWERVAIYLGFDAYSAQKVMGLAAYGDPTRFRLEMRSLLSVADDPGEAALPFRVDARAAALRAAGVDGLERLFGPRRLSDEAATADRFAAVARALQDQTERAVLAAARRLKALAPDLDALCFSGGVALNCVANAALERDGPFGRLALLGASHDAGTAVGGALLAALELAPALRQTDGAAQRPALGPALTPAAAHAALYAHGLEPLSVDDPVAWAAEQIAAGAICGWATGRMELGPRALGQRSVLADPRSPGLRERLNAVVKKREAFRPFGASVLEEAASTWFELPDRDAAGPRRLMLLAYPLRPALRSRVPAICHRDGTCRIQTVPRGVGAYRRLLELFAARTDVPLLLNTSFNDREPIVCTAAHAVRTALASGMDALVLGPYAVQLRR